MRDCIDWRKGRIVLQVFGGRVAVQGRSEVMMDALPSEIQIGGGAARRTIQGSQEMLADGPAGESSGTRVCWVYDVFDFDGRVGH